MNRRQLCTLIPVIPAAMAQHPAARTATDDLRGGTLGPAGAIPLQLMQERKTASGESWNIAHGTLPTGETVNLHQSMQVAGAPPVQIHAIQHSEFILVREGDLEFQHEVDGKTVSERVTAGGVLYIPFGTRHAVRNVGTTPARYFVVGIGGDAK